MAIMTSSFITTIAENPVGIFDGPAAHSNSSLALVKSYVDGVIQNQKAEDDSKTLLDEITVDGLDANQVWQQVKMIMESSGSKLLEKIGDLREPSDDALDSESEGDEELALSGSDLEGPAFGEDEEEEENEEEDEEQEEKETQDEVEEEESRSESAAEEERNEESDEDDGEIADNLNSKSDSIQTGEIADNSDHGKKSDKHGLNDEFFDIDEFNEQTLKAENEDVNENDSFDFFAKMSSEEDEEAEYYDDFFDKPKTKSRSEGDSAKRLATEGDHESSENDYEEEYDRAMESAKLDLFADVDDQDDSGEERNDAEELSTFQRQQLDIQRQIAQLEKEAVAEKKWALKGEVKAKDRPDDALLSEDLEFERTSKPVPVITAEVTESLEDLIRRRVLQYEFDDLARKVISSTSFSTPKPKFDLSDSKSSKSLAELYEEDYKGSSQSTEISEELQKAHDEISELYNDLMYKLDALSSAHFIPKPAQKQLEVKIQSAAINMEDAQPLTMSTASTLAPQEIYKPGASRGTNEISLKNGAVMSRDELSREDKNRLRRALKRKRSKQSQSRSEQSKKKSKRDDVIESLSQARNVTIIGKKGEKTDVKGNAKKTATSETKDYKL
ncbi:LAME_0C02652g1_1 [Lachancea meyersii CBS 8951]|uniref:U3 small nucleolar ribonucleoprotein protein MPP10 n=1 Tax=Lachancea meyersii CBS 8951 TaxID=1266667 RepID=A0A1G4IZM7_9SACH|nr:LAME_0C02652g1_1 [Lachancea meyersii CBS 8951]